MTGDPLDELAVVLRDRLVTRAREGSGGGQGLEADVRELVEREAAALARQERERLAQRVIRLAAGLGPLARCSPTRRSTRSW